MTNTPTEHPEDLRAEITEVIKLHEIAKKHGMAPNSPVENILALCKAAVLAARPEKIAKSHIYPEGGGLVLEEYSSFATGHNEAVDKYQANIHSVFGGNSNG